MRRSLRSEARARPEHAADGVAAVVVTPAGTEDRAPQDPVAWWPPIPDPTATTPLHHPPPRPQRSGRGGQAAREPAPPPGRAVR